MNHNQAIELNDIKAFVAVIDAGSFTNAAYILKVSKGHISKQIKQLEQAMNVQLVIRTTRSLSLTDLGKVFYEESKTSLTRLNQAISNTIDDASEISGSIRINSVGGIIGEDILSPIIAEFGVLYPKVDITLDFSSTRSDLIGDKFDLILRMGKLQDSGFMAKKIAEVNISTLAAPKYLSQHKKIRHPKELKELNCLTGSVKSWSFVNNKTQAKSEITVSGSFTCANGRALLNAAKSGLGIVRLPEIYCQDEIKAKKLIPVMHTWSVEKVPVHILYYSNKLQTRKLGLLIEFISRRFTKNHCN